MIVKLEIFSHPYDKRLIVNEYWFLQNTALLGLV